MENLSPRQRKIAAHVLISGRVQGVFYRASTQEAAQLKSVHGWVRNLPDGRVEALFEGTTEAVEAMIQWCHQGPPGARVTKVVVEYQEPEDLRGFEIQYYPR
jgi:acylphosphatase